METIPIDREMAEIILSAFAIAASDGLLDTDEATQRVIRVLDKAFPELLSNFPELAFAFA